MNNDVLLPAVVVVRKWQPPRCHWSRSDWLCAQQLQTVAHAFHGCQRQPRANMSPIPDELTATVISAVESLSALQKAKFLLEHSLSLLEAGQ
jgi:hypothetical protein